MRESINMTPEQHREALIRAHSEMGVSRLSNIVNRPSPYYILTQTINVPQKVKSKHKKGYSMKDEIEIDGIKYIRKDKVKNRIDPHSFSVEQGGGNVYVRCMGYSVLVFDKNGTISFPCGISEKTGLILDDLRRLKI
jgi:hypothetical protein